MTEKTVAIMQPYVFPYLGYWQLLQEADVFVVYDDVNYIKQGYISRNNILLNGQAHQFAISLEKPSPNKLINEIMIKDDFVKFRKTLEMNYKKAPNYAEAMAVLDQVFGYEDKNLARFLGNQIKVVAKHMGLNTEIVYSSDLHKDCSLKAYHKVLAIVHELGGSKYVNSIGGTALYDEKIFAENGINLGFMKMRQIEYPQFKNEFVPYLSVIDVMMFNKRSEMQELLKQYDVVTAEGQVKWRSKESAQNMMLSQFGEHSDG